MKVKLLFLTLLIGATIAATAQTNTPWTTNQNIGIGTTTPLAPLHVKYTVPLYGTITAQDANGSGPTGQAINTFIGANGNRLGYFGSSWGNFVVQNDQAGVVAVSPTWNGRVLIGGFTNYGNHLQVHGTAYVQDNLGIGTPWPNAKLEATGTIFSSSWNYDAGVYISGDNGEYGSVQATNSYNSDYKNLVLQEYGGNVAIGTNDPQGHMLSVNGDAIFTKAIVKLYNNWPDYVFHPAYKLPSIKEVETFIKQNRHLPEVPSVKEVEENGLDLGGNQATLLKKIEELTLYVIDINKRIEEQKILIEQQQKLIADQAKVLEQMRQIQK